MQVLTPADAVVATYREHGHALARGVAMDRVMAEMYGKSEGCSRSRGGSMHLFDAATRFYGGNAIVGGSLPLAVGLALAEKMQRRDGIAACFFGEGAVAEGEFHESLNLAELWRLPLLFVCENNLYAMGTRLERSESQPDIHIKAESYNVPAEAVDGMDAVAVEAATRRVCKGIRGGAGPALLECRTYRFRAHSMFDPQLYSDRAEIEEWKRRDPIENLAQWMREEGTLLDADLAAIEAEIAAEVAASVAFAEAGHLEPTAALTRDVYAAEGGQ
jgi:TPP-dependent pyruvate/acetoin dehydrogenase alpha subunit